ncbi:MAG TPA: acyl-CoA dehydrogenase family protein [Acidimicrobiales bacterium]|nr:acyl-CoA dehydrogenase family protein [Acidimicrobiales bacterium]
MDAEERELFAKSLGRATAQHTGEALDAALDELGWADALAADPRAAVAGLFEHQGAANATSSALDLVLAAGLGLDPSRAGLAVVVPPLGRWSPPGEAGSSVRGLGTAALARRAGAVVVSPTAGGAGAAAVVVAPDGLDLRTVGGIDPALGLVEVAGDGLAPASRPTLADGAWPAAVAAGQRALAHELVGASRTMLDLAREHALERVQFGRPIAAFQAVRHRLAEALVAVEAADAALGAAWDDGTPFSAAVAKAVAGRSARTVARHAQQVLAGIGFTTEHPLHRYVRRALVLDALLGGAHSLTRRLGEDLLAGRSLPSILPL